MNESSRVKGKHRGRSKKKTSETENDAKTDDSTPNTNDDKSNDPKSMILDLDADITQLEAPTFSTINKGPPEPMLRLNWNHKTHLIGEKVINPMIHCCDKCEAPILIYGRMVPCKHVFCFCCAERENKTCPRCHDKIVRTEKTGLGSVFMCTFGGTRYGNNGCRRTYLSQRDLTAHINHRHIVGISNKKELTNNDRSSISSRPSVPPPSRPKAPVAAVVSDPRKLGSADPPSSHSAQPLSSYNRPQSQHSAAPVPHPQQLVSSTPLSSSVTSINYSNSMLMTNFPSPTPTSIPNVMVQNFIHQSYPSQYLANPPSNTAFSVPPPIVPQTLAQYYPNSAIDYSTGLAQRPGSMQFANSPTAMMNQPRMIANSSSSTPRRSQYLGETTGPPVPVPPPQWHQIPMNQTHFY